MIQKTILLLVLIYVFYRFNITPITTIVHHLLVYWNIFVYTITHIKDNHSAVYVSLPFILVALLVWDTEDA